MAGRVRRGLTAPTRSEVPAMVQERRAGQATAVPWECVDTCFCVKKHLPLPSPPPPRDAWVAQRLGVCLWLRP